MNWLRRMRAKRHGSRPPSAGQREAERAVRAEERKLERTATESHAILEAAERLKELGASNDFAARIRHSLGG